MPETLPVDRADEFEEAWSKAVVSCSARHLHYTCDEGILAIDSKREVAAPFL
jgi:hypothetical protein